MADSPGKKLRTMVEKTYPSINGNWNCTLCNTVLWNEEHFEKLSETKMSKARVKRKQSHNNIIDIYKEPEENPSKIYFGHYITSTIKRKPLNRNGLANYLERIDEYKGDPKDLLKYIVKTVQEAVVENAVENTCKNSDECSCFCECIH